MSDLTTYRINRPESCICPEFRDVMPFRMADLACQIHGVSGSDEGDGYWKLVPDTRLQAIAAPRCEHGNIYPHEGFATFMASDEMSGTRLYECEGSPKLADLLDALTQEGK